MKQEERNKKLGMVISGAFHLLLVLAFLFVIAWKEPDPPLPQYGIELNFGTSDVGTGDIQPETAPQETPDEEEAMPEELPEESTEEVVEESEPEEEVTESQPEAVESTENTQESPDVVESVSKKTETKKVEEKIEEKPVTKPVEQKKTEKPAVGAQGKTGENQSPQNANQGDNQDKEGDKGDEQGTLDSRALYGQAGGGGGPALSIVGWIWDSVPNKKDNSSENGQIIIDFWIDDKGEVLRTQIIKTGVSMSVARFYEDQLRKTSFSPTNTGTISKPMTKGTVTFSIKSK